MVNLVNKLHGAMRKRAGKKVMGPILESLAEYTVRHFKEEEQLMAKAGFAELAAHNRLHEKLVGQVMDFKNQFESGSATVTMDLMNFLSDWLAITSRASIGSMCQRLKGRGGDSLASVISRVTGLIGEHESISHGSLDRGSDWIDTQSAESAS